MTPTPLIQPLFSGPIDIVGDVHGEIAALDALLRHLGYSADGCHAENRRLVFVGDLVDRGPDSPGVVEWVRRLIEAERAQCVMGNHELNILLGRRKPDNIWFFHHELSADHPAAHRPQAWADKPTQEAMLHFFERLPLALERSDVGVVHACWNEDAIAIARPARNAIVLHRASEAKIEAEIQRRRLGDAAVIKLMQQNENPVKLLTSGPEARAATPFRCMGKLRHERRVAWWGEYRGPLCVFGHYWRITLPEEIDNERLFTDVPLNATLGRGDALCIDYSVGKRFMERASPSFQGTFHTRLAALRLPERVLIFEDGSRLPLVSPD